ncbi:MAG: cellulase family glycosylhydrolase [Bacteroidaceae bacterium]|nr:cellulase family glycosylhydrolase [Bacteroidaceae bacterium]
MKKLYNFIILLFLLMPYVAQAQKYVYGTTPALHVQGNVLKDPSGSTVVLHGVMDTPSPYFNSYRWGEWWGGFNDQAVEQCRNYFDQITTAITTPEKGTYCNLFRLHMDPCWTNDPNIQVSNPGGEEDIRRFSADRLRTYFNSLYLPIALNALSKGLYVIIRPPGVFPQEVNVGGDYNNYLMTVWDIVSQNETLKQYSGQISLELGNEPVRVKNRWGQDDSNALHDFFQPIVEKIRQNGFDGILWIPGTGWQSNYQDYASHPIQDNNFGYAVHNYVGWYNGNNSTPYSQVNNYINQFHTQVPVIDTNPIVITEVDWSPEKAGTGHTDEHGNWVLANYGTWATGTTSNWGALYKALLDHYGTISMTLSGTDTYLDVQAYLDNGTVRPAYQTAMQANGYADAWEACSGACFQWYKEWALEQMSGDIPNSYQLGDDIFNYAPKVWDGQSNTYGGLGHTAYERYNSGSIGVGDVLTQTLTGVKSGTYNVTLELAGSFTPDRGFECPTGTGLSLAFANDQYRDLEIVRRDWVSSVQPITLSATVSEGTLKYGIRNIANSGNWYVANVTSIKYVSENTNNTFKVNTSAQHGTLICSASNAAAGTTVTLSATPAANYEFDSFTVTTCTGENVAVNGNSFVMPSADVTVTANFSLAYEVGDDIVAIAPTEWVGQTGSYAGLGYTVSERYKHGGDNGAGDVLTQTLTGLKNGVYVVTLEVAASFTSGRGFDCPTGDGLTVAFANDTQKNLEVVDRQGVGSVTPITIYAIVTDGTLKYGIHNLKTSGNWYIANVTGIKYISESTTLTHELTVSSAGLATLYLPFDAAIPDAEFFVVVAVKEISGSTAHLKRVRGGVLPANTGVMIYANEGTYSLPLATTASTENVESLLHGVLEDTPVTTLVAQEGKSIYVLSRGVKEYVGFKRLSGNGSVTYIPANRAYLPFSTSSQVNFINVSFGDTPTDIGALKVSIEDDSDEIYDLTGRKVAAPQKGIYIINGKKVLYK